VDDRGDIAPVGAVVAVVDLADQPARGISTGIASILSIFMMDCSEQGGAVIPIIRRSSGAAYRFCRAAAPGAWRSCPAAGLLARSRWL